MIRPLPDFTLFRLTPDGGLYVRGFGQAFEVSSDMKNSKHVTGNKLVRTSVASVTPCGEHRQAAGAIAETVV